MNETETFEIKGKPYFVLQQDEFFYTIQEARAIERDIGRQCWENIGMCTEQERFVLGENLIETPTKGLSIIIRGPEGQFIAPYFIGELRKLALVSWHDAVSVEKYGDSYSNYLGNDGRDDI